MRLTNEERALPTNEGEEGECDCHLVLERNSKGNQREVPPKLVHLIHF